MKEFIVTDMGKFCDIIENVKLNSTYRKSKIQLISNRNQRKLRASHLTQIENTRSSGVLYEMWFHQSKAYWQICTCLFCKDFQLSTKCVVEVMMKPSAS